MKSKIIAYVTAGAIALTGITSAPAQAGPNDDLVKFLAGAVLLGAIVHEVNKNNSQVTVTKNRPHRKNKQKAHRPNRQHTHVNRHKPRHCLRQRMTDHGWKTYYGRKCMQKAGWHKHDRRGKWHRSRRANR